MGILFFLIFVLIAGGSWYFFFYQSAMNELYDGKSDNKISGKTTAMAPGDTIPTVALQGEPSTLRDSISNTQTISTQTDTAKTTVSEPPVSNPVSELATTSTQPEPAPSPTTSQPATTTTPPTNAASSNTVLARVKLERGHRLTLLAEQYYGHKVFWVYIYEHNKAKIGSNPDRVQVGMELIIPAKAVYDIDANSRASVEKAAALQTRIMTSYWY